MNNFILSTAATHQFMWHTFKKDGDAAILTGWDPEGYIQPGTKFIDHTAKYSPEYAVIDVIERRDHKGSFTHASAKKNSFFKAQLHLTEETIKRIQELEELNSKK
jgi:hypothetical protein